MEKWNAATMIRRRSASNQSQAGDAATKYWSVFE